MKRRTPVLAREAMASEIASLSKLGTDELRERWKAMFGKAPSHDITRSFVTRAIAYRLQEKAFGGLKPSTRRLLADFAHNGADGSAVAAAPSRIVQPGAMLVREWRGISHQVSVLEKGFRLRRSQVSHFDFDARSGRDRPRTCTRPRDPRTSRLALKWKNERASEGGIHNRQPEHRLAKRG
jgi:hypothetical protein